MIRDPGPIHNLGNSVTSRDVPIPDGEKEGDSPNSGYISKALGEHPVARFLASSAIMMGVGAILSKMVRGGGLKLIKYTEDQAVAHTGLTSNLIQSVKHIRRNLDELQGVSRHVDSIQDPYSKLVHEIDGKLTTGYEGIASERFGWGFLTAEERALQRTGILGESAVSWTARDQLQQNLIRAGRRLPYELPAFYIVDKALVDPLFGDRKHEERKVKWYNPVDVVADFTKESVKNIATTMLPFEGLGVAASQLKSSLHTLRYSNTAISNANPYKQTIKKGISDTTELLSDVGNDLAKVGNILLRKSSQTAGAFDTATAKFREDNKDFTQSFKSLKKGLELFKAEESMRLSNGLPRGSMVGAALKGYESAATGEKFSSIFDLVPAFKGIQSAIISGSLEFKKIGKAQEAMGSPLAKQRILRENPELFPDMDALESTIKKVRGQHKSRLTQLAFDLRNFGPGDSLTDQDFGRGGFSYGIQSDAFKGVLKAELKNKNIDSELVDKFVSNLGFDLPRSSEDDVTKIITLGKSKQFEYGDSPSGERDNFFAQILERFKRIKGGEELSDVLTPEQLRESVENARDIFVSSDFQEMLQGEIKRNWEYFYQNQLQTVAEGLLPQKKANFEDFITNKNSVKLEFLQRKALETSGAKVVDAQGRRLSIGAVREQLEARGFDSTNFESLRAYLIKNRQMTSGIFGGFNIFGLQQVTIDEAQRMGKFDNLEPIERRYITDIAARTRLSDPTSIGQIGFSRVAGLYKTKSGETLDFNLIKSVAGEVGNFFATEFKIPILNFNPTDLFAYKSFMEMSKRSSIQYVSANSVQPFIRDTEAASRQLSRELGRALYSESSLNTGLLPPSTPDFYIWSRTRGTKGKLTSFFTDEFSGTIFSDTLKGTYRPVPTSTAEMITRHTRYGSANEGMSPEEIREKSNSPFLTRLFGGGQEGDTRARRVKEFMFHVDSEQPNSIFKAASRFARRRYDLQNEVTMAELLKTGTITRKRRGISETLKLGVVTEGTTRKLRVVDQAGAAVSDISEGDVLRGIQNLSKNLFEFGTPTKVVSELEQLYPNLFTFGGKKVSKIGTEEEAIDFAKKVINSSGLIAQQIKSRGGDPTPILSSLSRIQSLLTGGNLSSTSSMAERSPTISTRLDELKDEIFRYVAQSNAFTSGSSTDDIFIKLQMVIDELYRNGTISASQKAEAQAAGLATLFNISAFKTFKNSASNIESARAQALELFSAAQRSPEIQKLFETYSEGEIARVGGSLKKKFSPLLAPAKKKLGYAGYHPDELDVDPLGSGQSVTMVPTFGTVFRENPMGAILNAAGLTTYSDPGTFSTGSIPVSQSVERLNRYFGTIGLQLDVSKFKGPLDLFGRGMVGERVLPMYAAGVTALTVDRMIGGFVNDKDENGERVYSPFFLGNAARVGVEAHAAAAGLIPGGMGYEEKREQLLDGEVPIRQGRFWPLGNTPFQGGKIMYYRPSWYRRLQAGAMFTEDTYGSPMEKFLFYNDISPLRPFDPYRFEREHYYDRPYPVTGEYFTGPFGPVTPLLNATLGKVLKPSKLMHEEELQAGLASYVPAGEFGAYDPSAFSGFSAARGTGFGSPMAFGGGSISGGFGSPFNAQQAAYNQEMASRAGSTFLARNIVSSDLSSVNNRYQSFAYGPPKVSKVMPPRIVPAGEPLVQPDFQFQASEFGYRTQEMLGIYGFGIGSLREGLGFGRSDLEPQRSVLQSASKAYGSSRSFWDLNLGGLGDVPIGGSEGIGNIEFSEIVRRFIPKDRTGVDFINPIQNTMGQQYPFLPGPEYYINFKTGDPFTKVQEGELRLPGVGYERLNKLHPDEYGKYGLIDQLNILGDVAPYSEQFKRVNRLINQKELTPQEKLEVEKIRQQAEDVTHKYDFSEYKYKGSSPAELGIGSLSFGIGRLGEAITHSDNIIINKTIGRRSATEDWERTNVYGTTFPQWQNPIDSYIKPMLNKATQENPLIATASLAAVGSLFGRTPRATLFGSLVGGAAGLAASATGNVSEFISGERYIPETRKKELALEEYSDILSYVKNTRLANISEMAGDRIQAQKYSSAAKRTMYGTDVDGGAIQKIRRDLESGEAPSQGVLDSLSLAVPKRKREHFKAMLVAPEEEREKILSTAGRLERRIYEAAWGMKVEKKPDLEDYFARHELPDESWEGWHPNTNLDHVKIKTGQHMGLDMSQMGYYPQQIKEANLANPSYPEFFGTNSGEDIQSKLRNLMSGAGVQGTVTPIINPFGTQQFNVSAGYR